MNESAYIFIAILFAIFLGTVILSNILALMVTFVISLVARRKAKRL